MLEQLGSLEETTLNVGGCHTLPPPESRELFPYHRVGKVGSFVKEPLFPKKLT